MKKLKYLQIIFTPMEKRDALLLVFSTAIISGVSIFLNKYAVKGIDSSIFTFSKNIIVALFFISLIFITSKFNEFKKLNKKDWLSLLVIGFIGGATPFIIYFKGLQMTSAANASLIHKSMFIFVTLFALLFLKEKLNKKVVFASLILLIGNYLLLRPSSVFLMGDLLILVATLFWAVENIISKRILANLSGNIVAFGRMFFGSLFILIYLFATGKTSLIISLTSTQLIWILITSLMLIFYVFTWYNGLKHIDVSLATSILLLGSPITTFLNIASGAPISYSEAFGIVLLISGVVLFMNSTKNFSIRELRKTWATKKKA